MLRQLNRWGSSATCMHRHRRQFITCNGHSDAPAAAPNLKPIFAASSSRNKFESFTSGNDSWPNPPSTPSSVSGQFASSYRNQQIYKHNACGSVWVIEQTHPPALHVQVHMHFMWMKEHTSQYEKASEYHLIPVLSAAFEDLAVAYLGHITAVHSAFTCMLCIPSASCAAHTSRNELKLRPSVDTPEIPGSLASTNSIMLFKSRVSIALSSFVQSRWQKCR